MKANIYKNSIGNTIAIRRENDGHTSICLVMNNTKITAWVRQSRRKLKTWKLTLIESGVTIC